MHSGHVLCAEPIFDYYASEDHTMAELEAVYENGVLRPLQPLALSEHQRVTLIIAESVDGGDGSGWCDTGDEQLLADSGEPPALDAVRAALATIPGSLTVDFIAERDDR